MSMIFLLQMAVCVVSLSEHSTKIQTSFLFEIRNNRLLNIHSKRQNQIPMKSVDDKTATNILWMFSTFLGKSCSYVGGFLRRMDVRNVVMYSSDLSNVDCLLVNDLDAQNGVNIKWKISGEKKSANCFGTKMAGVECMMDVDLTVIANSLYSKAVARYFIRRTESGLIYLKSILNAVSRYENRYRLIERIHALRKVGVQAFILQLPNVERVSNRSNWEQMIVWNNYSSDLLPLPGQDAKYTREAVLYLRKPSNKVINYKDYIVCSDVRRNDTNIVNHIRHTAGVSHNAQNSVHIFGDSTAYGAGVVDEDTISSFLQKHINNVFKKKGSLSVYNYGVYGMTSDMIQRRIRDVVMKLEDCVVVVGYHSRFNSLHEVMFKESCGENGVLFYNSQADFNRPHSYGEVFLSHMHLNQNGNRRIAEIVFGKLFVTWIKTFVPELFTHYYCGGCLSTTTSHVETYTTDLENEYISTKEFRGFLRNLENRRGGECSEIGVTGTLVMNCNPFTRGHLYLVEVASQRVGKLYVFIVEEDKSEFPFSERIELVKAGTSSLPSVVVLPSSRFMISGVTLPEYFVKGDSPDAQVDASMDLEIFGKWFVPSLGIDTRLVGEEPFDKVTLQYNNAMKEMLPKYNVTFGIIPRKEFGKSPISASRVRSLLKKSDFREIASIVPPTTLTYLLRKSINFGGTGTQATVSTADGIGA